jgi:sugar phosphate isomerase/epimerase
VLDVVFAICNETFQDWPFDKAFAFARECGYTGIEFAPFTMGSDAMSISQEKRSQIRAQLADAGLEAVGLHWLLAKTQGYYLTSPDRAVQKRTSAYLGELARLCCDIGGRIMVLGSPQQRNLLPGVTHEDAMAYACDVIRAAVPALEDCDVTLALEPLGPAEGDFLLTHSEAIELIGMVGSASVQLHLDVKAMSSESTPIPRILSDSRACLRHFHANDPNRRGPGMGDVDFAPIFQALRQIDYSGWISVEVFDYEPGIERLAKESIDYMRRVAADIGL